VSTALAGKAEYSAQRSSSIVSRFFAYLGGTFVFVGLGIFVDMRWDDLGPAGRVLLTLGPGLCLFVLALVCTTDARVEGAATPLFLVAGLVQPTGILVMLAFTSVVFWSIAVVPRCCSSPTSSTGILPTTWAPPWLSWRSDLSSWASVPRRSASTPSTPTPPARSAGW